MQVCICAAEASTILCSYDRYYMFTLLSTVNGAMYGPCVYDICKF